MIPFEPYVMPHYGEGEATFDLARVYGFVLARGETWGFQIPQNSTRMQIWAFDRAYKVYGRQGTTLINYPSAPVKDLACRLPPNSVVEVYANLSQLTITDVLYFQGTDRRNLSLEERIDSYWFAPSVYNKRQFFNETSFYDLLGRPLIETSDLFPQGTNKIIFKPNFVTYPIGSSYREYNWLLMRVPGVGRIPVEKRRNTSSTRLRLVDSPAFPR